MNHAAPVAASAQLRNDLVAALMDGLGLYLDDRPPPPGEVWTLLIDQHRGFSLALRSWDYLREACQGCDSVDAAQRKAAEHPVGSHAVILAGCARPGCLKRHAHFLVIAPREEAAPPLTIYTLPPRERN